MKNPAKGTYIKRGGFLPILGSLAKPLLISTAGAVGGEMLQ